MLFKPNNQALSFLLRVSIVALLSFFLILVINYSLYSLLKPGLKVFQWDYSSKYSYLEANINEYDSLIFGSSRTKRQLKPSLINQALGTKIFSFGVGGLAPSNNLYLFEQVVPMLLNSEIKTIYFELLPYDLNQMRLDSPFEYYCSQPRDDLEALWSFRSYFTRTEFLHKFKTFSKISFNKFTRAIRIIFQKERQVKVDYSKNLGYQKIEKAIKQNFLKEKRSFCKREKYIFNRECDFSTLTSDSEIATHILKTKEKQSKKIKEYYDRHLDLLEPKSTNFEKGLIDIVDNFKKHDIEVIFFVPQAIDFELVKAQFPRLIKRSKLINLSDKEKYPEFYDKNNLFDETHLNTEAAPIFTNKFIEAVEQKLYYSQS